MHAPASAFAKGDLSILISDAAAAPAEEKSSGDSLFPRGSAGSFPRHLLLRLSAPRSKSFQKKKNFLIFIKLPGGAFGDRRGNQEELK